MGIDSSIYFQQQATPDVMGAISKGMEMRDMMRKQAISERQDRTQAMLSAAIEQDPTTGRLTFNPQKFGKLSSGDFDPNMVMQAQQQAQQQKAQAQELDHKMLGEKLDLGGKVGGSVTNQAQADAARALLKAHGYDDTELPGQAYNPDDWKAFAGKSLSQKDRLASAAKDREVSAQEKAAQAKADEADVAKKKLPLYAQEVGAKLEGNKLEKTRQGNQDYAKELQQTQQMLESARGNPEVGQALKDRYAANKLNSLVGGDPDKLSPQMVQLAASEVAKIATGGVPQTTELQHLTPHSLPGTLADSAQYFLNSPTPANQGAFLKQYQNYANSLKQDANNVINERIGRVIESKKPYLHPRDYSTLKSQYSDQNKSEAAHPVDKMNDDEVRQAYQQMQAAKAAAAAGGAR